MSAERHPDESLRLAVLRGYGILDTPRESDFNEIVALAAEVCEAPIAVVNLIDDGRQWFKAEVGLGVRETPIDSSICAHAILQKGFVEVPDLAADPRFADNPLVTGDPGLRFYAGALLQTDEGLPLGTLCVLDDKPRTLNDLQRHTLQVLARQVMAQLELRKRLRDLTVSEASLQEAERSKAREREEIVSSLDAADIAMWVVDYESGLVFTSPRLRFLFGLTGDTPSWAPQEVYFDAVHPDDREVVRQRLAESATQGAKFGVEFRVTGLDGQERWVFSKGTATVGPAGSVMRLTGAIIDITERQQTEQALRRSEERTRLAADAVGIGIWEWEPASDVATWENERPYEIFGISRSEEPLNAARFVAEAVHPDDVAQFHESAKATVERGEPFAFLGRIRRTDGGLRWIELKGQPQPAPAGTPMRVLGTVMDVTEAKQAEERERQAANDARTAAEANAKFRTFFDQGSYFAGVMTTDGTLIEANRLCLDACGYTRDEVIGEKFWDCGWWNRSSDLKKMVYDGAAQAASGRLFRTETPYFLADGTERMVDLVIAPVKDDTGRTLFLAPTGTDITERKRAEARDRFLVALDDAVRPLTNPGEITLTAATLIGTHLKVDRCAYADIEDDEDTMNLAGNYLRSPEIRSIVGQMKFADFGAEVLALMRANEPYVVNDVDTHLPPVGDPAAYRATQIQAVICVPLHKRGRFVAAMAVHCKTPRIWRADEVELVQLVAARCWESIERGRITRGLRESEERFRAVFENAPDDAIILMAPDRSILEWNPAAETVCGWTADEAMGQPGDIIFCEDDRMAGAPEAEADKAVREGKSADERWHQRKDGGLFWGSGTMSAPYHPDRSVRGFLKVFRDATERHEIERRVKELNEELERRVEERTSALVAKNAELEGFSYSVSHDMRAPLRAIVGRARMVLDDEGPRLSEQGKTNLERLAKAAGHMAQLVDDLLQFARLGTRELRLETVNLETLAQEVGAQVRADRPDCTLELETACDVTVDCDPRFIGMAVHNLIDNACKYRKAGEPARVTVGCEHRPDGLVFYVRDQGIGFDMAYVHKLFVPFERLHREEYPGTGIGLANVRRAIERHGGRVWAEGAVNEGATFYFTLG